MDTRHIGIMVLCFVACSRGRKVPAARQEAAEANLHVDEFGIMQGKPVDKGFVFFDGQYLDAPYVVTRKGLAIFINDKMIVPPIPWPQKQRPSGDVDPQMPPEITRGTSLYDDVLTDYLDQKAAYFVRHYAPEEERDLMEQVLRSLPCFKEVELDPRDPHILRVTTFRGETCNFVLVSLRGRKLKFDKESVLRRVEGWHEYFEDGLREGDCYFFSQGSWITLGGRKDAQQLAEIVKTLRSSRPENVKFREVQRAGLPVDEEDFRNLVTNFSASRQLEKRLEELTGE